MKNLPKKIYLNLGDLSEEEFNDTDFNDLPEVTWSEEDVQGRNVEYVLKEAFVKKACEYWYQYNRDIVKRRCNEFTVHVEDFKKYMERN